jgi:hypothetical protein
MRNLICLEHRAAQLVLFCFKPINYDDNWGDHLAAYSFPIINYNELIGTCIPVTVDGWDNLLLLDMTSGRMSKKGLTLCAFYNASHYEFSGSSGWVWE